MKYSEILFALFIAVSRIKGDPRIADLLPFDLTVLFGLAVYVVIVFQLRQYDWSLFPRVFWLYLPFIVLLIFSVFYSPLPYAGAAKALKFILLTGLAIVAPFFVLHTPSRMRNFFLTLFVVYFAASLDALSHSGDPVDVDSDGRLTVTGGSTIELGTSAVIGIIIILFVFLPQLKEGGRISLFYLKKGLLYLAITVFFLALLGAGARSATIALIVVVLLNAFFYRQRIPELLLVACLAASSLLFVDLPEYSLKYLDTLIHSDADSLLNWRGHLMRRGLELIAEYPILGVGLGGFPYYKTIPSPAPWLLYNWPHNGIIEIGCEVGLVAAMIACLLIILSFVETFRQLADQEFQYKLYSRMSLVLLTTGFITFMNTGDINDERPMWLYMSLPFVIRGFERKST